MGADNGPLPQVRWHARTRTHRHDRTRTHADKLKHACARTCTSFSCRPAILQGWLGRTVPCAAVCCRCGSSPELWFVHLSGAFVFVGAQTACAITEASEPRGPLAAASSFGYCGGYSGYAEGLQHDPPRRLLMAAIVVVYPCLLAYMIYVHNKKGGLEVPQILMKYGHFFTGARRRPSAMALYRPEISAHNTWHTCRLQAERLATLFLWATKLSREPFVRTHPGRLPAVCYVTSCDCTHARTRTCMHAHTDTRTQTCLQTCAHTHARTHAD